MAASPPVSALSHWRARALSKPSQLAAPRQRRVQLAVLQLFTSTSVKGRRPRAPPSSTPHAKAVRTCCCPALRSLAGLGVERAPGVAAGGAQRPRPAPRTPCPRAPAAAQRSARLPAWESKPHLEWLPPPSSPPLCAPWLLPTIGRLQRTARALGATSQRTPEQLNIQARPKPQHGPALVLLARPEALWMVPARALLGQDNSSDNNAQRDDVFTIANLSSNRKLTRPACFLPVVSSLDGLKRQQVAPRSFHFIEARPAQPISLS